MKTVEATFTDRLAKRGQVYVHILLSWRSLITFAVCSLATALYFSISWMPLQIFLAKVIVTVLRLQGYLVFQVENFVAFRGLIFEIDSVCTYVILILIGLPFLWRGDRLGCDVLRVIFFAATVSAVNILRVYLAIVWHARGIPWKYAHDLVNHLTYCSIVVLIVLFWLKAMKLHLTRKSDVNHNSTGRQPRKASVG